LDLGKIRPLEKMQWAGAVDNLGGQYIAWLASCMQMSGTIASIGLAAGMEFKSTVAPFILRGVCLLGIDSGFTPMPLRSEVWRRLATDLRPRHLQALTRTISFDDLLQAFGAFIDGQVRGRTVVAIGGEA
ncbi:MAG: oxidoreductase, partial [Burkholderiales bacterium]